MPRAGRPRSQRLRGALTDRLALKGTAVFLALVLWIIVSSREETEGEVPVRFAPQLDESLSLTETPEVTALVRGIGREVLELRQRPPVIRRRFGGDLPDTVQLELSERDVVLPPGVVARVVDVRPRLVTLVFRSTATRTVPVRSGLVVLPDSTAAIDAAQRWAVQFDPDSVRVSGRRRALARVTAVRTVVDTLAARDGEHRTVQLDVGALAAQGLRVRPAEVTARVVQLALDSAAGEALRTRGATTRALVPHVVPPRAPAIVAEPPRHDAPPPHAQQTSGATTQARPRAGTSTGATTAARPHGPPR